MHRTSLVCNCVIATVSLAMLSPPLAAESRPHFRDASDHLPMKDGLGHSMNAKAADIDQDGDLDLVVAMERQPNRLLVNDGTGRFVDRSAQLPRAARDSEEVALVDIDADKDLDIAVANEDDLLPELYLNDGRGRFSDASDRVRVRVKANAVVAFDANNDGRPDLFFGGDKVSVLFMNTGRGRFRDASIERLPATYGATQQVAAVDVNADGATDLILANEDRNQLYLNDGRGVFTLAPPGALPPPEPPQSEETRDVEAFDANGDGRADILFANVKLFGDSKRARSRLLLNDGGGIFRDVTSEWLAWPEESRFAAAPIDLDADGRLDVLTAGIEDLAGKRSAGPVRAFRNTGKRFEDVTGQIIPAGVGANGFDLTVGDYDRDGKADVFIASRGGPDRLLLSSAPPSGN